MKKLKNKYEIQKGQILAVETMGQIYVGQCTGITTYPGDKLWYTIKGAAPEVGIAIGRIKDELDNESIYVGSASGFFGFDHQPVFDVTP